jgi:hypothetical protein
MDFAVEQGRAELAMRMVTATWRFWQMRGYLAEGRERARRALELPHAAEHPEVLEKAVEAAGGIAYWQGDMEGSRELYARQEELAAQRGDERGQALAIYNRSMTYALEYDATEAAALANRALGG